MLRFRRMGTDGADELRDAVAFIVSRDDDKRFDKRNPEAISATVFVSFAPQHPVADAPEEARGRPDDAPELPTTVK